MKNKKDILILFGLCLFFFEVQAQSRTLGNKSYEVSNHLGNVMTVVSDRKVATPETTNLTIAFNETDIKAYNDYYPYGMLLEERNDSKDYRYGFQGQEKDNEVKGENNGINYKYRVHDPRLGRFFAVDPLSSEYPQNSQYAFSENRMLDRVEFEGLEGVPFDPGVGKTLTIISKERSTTIIQKVSSTQWEVVSPFVKHRTVSVEESEEIKPIIKSKYEEVKKKRGFHTGLWTYDAEGQIKGGLEIVHFDFGSYKHNLKGKNRTQEMFPTNIRQKAIFFNRVHKRNLKILDQFNYGLSENEKWSLKDLIEIVKKDPGAFPKFKDPRIYNPKFRIEILTRKGSWWKNNHRNYRKTKWYKKYKDDKKMYSKEKKRKIERRTF